MIDKLFNKPIIVSEDDMDKSEGHEMKKITPIIRNWFNRLIKQSVMGQKQKIIGDKVKEKRVNDISRHFTAEKEDRK